MGCSITAGITKECAHSFGGLKELKIGNFSEVSSLDYDPTTGNITGVTLTSGATIYDYEFVKDSGQALEELVENGASSYVNQTINAQFNSITQAKKEVLNSLSLGTFFVIAKKSDDSYWFYGEPSKSAGLEATVVSIDSGTAQGDVSAASVTLVGASLEYASTVDSTVVDGL